MTRSPCLAFDALIIAAVFAIMSESLAFRASMKVMALIGMVAIRFSGDRSLFSILMDSRVLFLEIMYDPFSYEMRGDIVGNNGEFGGVSNGVDDAMSNGGGDGGG